MRKQVRKSLAINFWPISGLLLSVSPASIFTIAATFTPAITQEPSDKQLPAGLQFVPNDAAVFLYSDLAKIWQHPIAASIRKADQKLFDDLTVQTTLLFGLKPEDVSSVVAFLPAVKEPGDFSRVGLVIGLRKAYDKDKILNGVKALLPKDNKIKVVPVDDRLVLVLVGLGDEYAKPRPAGNSGPLTPAIQDAASGKHAAVLGVTLENLPEELRRDDVPAFVRPFQPLFKAVSIRAALDLGKAIDVDVRVKAATADQAVDCEKSLGALLTVIQESLGDGIKELDPEAAKNAGLKELIALMKAGMATAKDAKYSTQANETKLTASLQSDLPYTAAYMAARKKITDQAARQQAQNNLRQIAIAMHNYHSAYGAFPPAAVCDKKGNPQLSWRVLILPFIEQESLYKEFKIDEPWDSEHNKKLLAKMPKAYAIPGITRDGGADTHFRVFVGKGAGFDWLIGTKLTSIADGTSNTIMCVTADKAVPWTKPDELEFDPEKDMTKLLGSLVDGSVLAAFYDGSVHRFAKMPSQKTLSALITRDGGEVVEIP